MLDSIATGVEFIRTMLAQASGARLREQLADALRQLESPDFEAGLFLFYEESRITPLIIGGSLEQRMQLVDQMRESLQTVRNLH